MESQLCLRIAPLPQAFLLRPCRCPQIHTDTFWKIHQGLGRWACLPPNQTTLPEQRGPHATGEGRLEPQEGMCLPEVVEGELGVNLILLTHTRCYSLGLKLPHCPWPLVTASEMLITAVLNPTQASRPSSASTSSLKPSLISPDRSQSCRSELRLELSGTQRGFQTCVSRCPPWGDWQVSV